MSANRSHPAKRIKIDDLLFFGGGIPLTTISEYSVSLSPATLDEIKHTYLTLYATAIDRFLETSWFQNFGLARLLGDKILCDQFAACIEMIKVKSPSDALIAGMETRLIWSLMCMCRSPLNNEAVGNLLDVGENAGAGGGAELDDSHVAAHRLWLFENLVSGAIIDSDPFDYTTILCTNQAQVHEMEFWRLTGAFLTLSDDEATSAKQIDDVLAQCHKFLDGKEERDVIYTIAVARHLGQRIAEFPEQTIIIPSSFSDPTDERSKLAFSQQYIQTESVRKDTSVVVRAVCRMARKSWTALAAGSR